MSSITTVINDDNRKCLLLIWLGECFITHCNQKSYVDDADVITIVIVCKSL